NIRTSIISNDNVSAAPVRSLRIGNFVANDFWVMVSQIRLPGSESYDGIIGASLLNQFISCFDFPNEKFIIHEKLPENPGHEVKLTYKENVPYMKLRLKDTRAQYLLDMGYCTGFIDVTSEIFNKIIENSGYDPKVIKVPILDYMGRSE